MLFKRSLRINFLLKLIVAMATLVLITSFSLFIYIRYNSNYQLEEHIKKQATFLLNAYPDLEDELKQRDTILKNTLDLNAKIASAPFMNYRPSFFRVIKDNKKFLIQGFFPYKFRSQSYLILTKDITKNIKFENRLYKAIIFLNAASLIVIIFYAFFLSKMLIKPIKYFSNKIAKMNESKLAQLSLDTVPEEFKPLGNSINQLIGKIESFLLYKKELFIGAAHELKTPLAVIKTKSQVTLLKRDKNIDTLSEALRLNIKSIDNLNMIVESILAFGRAEGAQFEEAKEIDIIEFIKELSDEFEIIAIKEEKFIINKLKPYSLKVKIKKTLLRHILQNIIQNAIKFSPRGSKIEIKSFVCKDNLVIRVKDSGEGIPDNLDLFAPFKRTINSSGTGLGLFLAKSAADSMGGTISIKNRNKYAGTVATLILPFSST